MSITPIPTGSTRSGAAIRPKGQPTRAGTASFFFHDPVFRSDAVKVLPGEFFVTDDDIMVTTTLGSCIAACLWDRQRRIGGMNHFLLPDGGDAGGAYGSNGRYGNFAMDLLIGEMVKRGAARDTMEAKVFGGGAVISGMTSLNVGERNTAFVLDYLRTERITVVSKDVRDIYPRKVCFFPANGRAMVKRLASANTQAMTALQEQERSAAASGTPSESGGTIDLF